MEPEYLRIKKGTQKWWQSQKKKPRVYQSLNWSPSTNFTQNTGKQYVSNQKLRDERLYGSIGCEWKMKGITSKP